MKKFLLSVMTLCLSISMFAISYSGKVSVTVYDGTLFPTFHVGESADIAPGTLENGFYAPIQDLENEPIAIYALYNNVAYENLVLNTVENLPMGIKASNANDYTLYFANKAGTIRIYDKVADQEIDLANPYPFSITDAQKGTYINDRFVINYNPAAFVVSVTTNEDGWASFAYTADVAPAYPSGLAMYKGALDMSDAENPAINLSAVSAVPANAGVFVKGAPLTTYYFSATTAAAFSDNDIVGCAAATPVSDFAGKYIYTLRYASGATGLYNYEGVADIPAGKAVLPIPQGSFPVHAPRRIALQINDAQGINNVEESVKAVKFVENGEILIKRGENVFNLQGQIVK